jgi:hypothetical protein
MRVFDGGAGWMSGGRSEKSIDSGDLDLEDDRECCGEGIVAAMMWNMSEYYWVFGSVYPGVKLL